MVTVRGGEDVSVQPVLEHAHDGPWTWEDLPSRDELRGWRAEIVDGGLVLMPPEPSLHHNLMAMRLAVLLDGASPPEWLGVAPGSVAYRLTYRVPDLIVARRELVGPGPISPAGVLLAAEVQSPGSVTNDRVTKMQEYAAVGIPHYWRLEVEPEPLLQAFALVDGTYAEVCTVRGDEAYDFVVPFAVRVSPAALLR